MPLAEHRLTHLRKLLLATSKTLNQLLLRKVFTVKDYGGCTVWLSDSLISESLLPRVQYDRTVIYYAYISAPVNCTVLKAQLTTL
jgi:hypothetical protein